MAEQRMVPVELLEESWEIADRTVYASDGYKRKLRAIIDGTGVEPVATLVAPPLDSMKDNFWMTEEDAIRLSKLPYGTRLYLAAPSAPIARCHECGKLASDGWALYCVECAEKGIAPAQAVPAGWQLINRTPTPEQRELLLRADEFTVPEMWVMLLAAAPQPSKESTAQSVACSEEDYWADQRIAACHTEYITGGYKQLGDFSPLKVCPTDKEK